MPNRNLQAKHERAMRQRQERAAMEYGKTGYQTARPFEADNAKREYLPEPRKVEWFNRKGKKVSYVPTPCKRRQHTVSAVALAAWSNDVREWRQLTHRGRVVLRAAD